MPELAHGIVLMLTSMLAAIQRWRMDWAPPELFAAPLWNRLLRMARHLVRLAEAHAAGRLRPRAARAEATPPIERPTEKGKPLPPRALPGGHGWLLGAMRHFAAPHANRLQAMLADPGMVAFLAASPTAVRLIRPFCRLLAVPTNTLPRPARRPRPPKPPEPLARPVFPSGRFVWPPRPFGPPAAKLPRKPRRWSAI